MSEITTEPGRWLLDEYRRTPGDPKWHPGMGLESTIIAIEQGARAAALAEVFGYHSIHLAALRKEVEALFLPIGDDVRLTLARDDALNAVLAVIDRRLA